MHKLYKILNKQTSNLPNNWDSYGAIPPHKASILGAKAFIKEVIDHGWMQPYIFPVPDGTIQFEFDITGNSVEIVIRNIDDYELHYEGTIFSELEKREIHTNYRDFLNLITKKAES